MEIRRHVHQPKIISIECCAQKLRGVFALVDRFALLVVPDANDPTWTSGPVSHIDLHARCVEQQAVEWEGDLRADRRHHRQLALRHEFSSAVYHHPRTVVCEAALVERGKGDRNSAQRFHGVGVQTGNFSHGYLSAGSVSANVAGRSFFVEKNRPTCCGGARASYGSNPEDVEACVILRECEEEVVWFEAEKRSDPSVRPLREQTAIVPVQIIGDAMGGKSAVGRERGATSHADPCVVVRIDSAEKSSLFASHRFLLVNGNSSR